MIVDTVTHTVAGTLGLCLDDYAVPYLASWSESTDLASVEQRAALIDRLAKRIEDATLAANDRAAPPPAARPGYLQ